MAGSLNDDKATGYQWRLPCDTISTLDFGAYVPRPFRLEEKDPLAAGMERDGVPLWLLSFPSFFKRVRIADLFHLLFKMNVRAAFSVTPVAFYFYPLFFLPFCSLLPRLLSSFFSSFSVFLFCLAQPPLFLYRTEFPLFPFRSERQVCGFSSARKG